MKPFLLLATRSEDAAADSEYASMLKLGGLTEDQLHRLRLESQPLPELDLDAYSGIIVGGSPFTSSVPDAHKSDTQRRVEAELSGLLDELSARRIPAAIATSSGSAHALRHLGTAGLIDRFVTIVTRDDVADPKPHPEPYLTAAARLRIDPADCLAVEDSRAGVQAAHAAGMQTVMVPDLVHPTDEIVQLCAAVLDSLHHLREAVFAPAPTGANSGG